MIDEDVKTCQGCGASIYPEHIESGMAGQFQGKLLCSHCIKDLQQKPKPQEEEALGPISLLEMPEPEPEPESLITSELDVGGPPERPEIVNISSESVAGTLAAAFSDDRYDRPLNKTGQGATRCRTFHAKLNDGAIGFMNEQINEWLDGNTDIEIKSSSSTIGVFEGKSSEPHLILTVLY